LKILVAVNGSEASKKALEYALDIAKKVEGNIYVIHVIEEVPIRISRNIACLSITTREVAPPPIPIPRSLKMKITREALKVLEYARLKAEEMKIYLDFIICEGDPVSKILEESAKGYDFLVLGFGVGGWLRPRFGSVMEKILWKSKIPVLVVK